MEPFPATQEPDEGYSEHPLDPNDSGSLARDAALICLRSPADMPAWLSSQLPKLSVSQKRHLAMLILNELPTTAIADIVMTQLNPRLYINFVEYLPTEICLKILGYLDSVSLIHVAMCCRSWYDLALDRKLWERAFYLEGWKVIQSEISAAEQRINDELSSQIQSHELQSTEDEHVHKKRALLEPTSRDDEDYEMVDADTSVRQELHDAYMTGTSLFGGPVLGGAGSPAQSGTSVIQHMGDLMMKSPSPMPDLNGKAVSTQMKGKAVAISDPLQIPVGFSSLPKSTLWTYDTRDRKFKISWKYLYTMRRRLEHNWDRGRYTNFQLPHPDHLEEGHNECIYSLQYNPEYLVSGSRDRTLRIWNLRTRRLIRPPLRGHQGSVLCLQFDSDPEEDLIVSGSSDSDVILWKFSTGEIIQRLRRAHRESVLNVKFDKRILVTCSKDKSIKIFNRVPLRPGDPGNPGNPGNGDVQGVSPVPTSLRNYGYDDSPLNQLPIIPPYKMIACLEGHSAAVNAVQICGNEIVSASGDRHIKLWDWPNQICKKVFLGHNKGIACVQYDGRRIVSGSSDNEVKVFDRESGLEVASLRAHSNLVRTVQAGFGDLPYSVVEDQREAKAVDQAYFKAFNAGKLHDLQTIRNRPQNAGSRRPEDITAYGAKLPPGGGGGPYGRIVSGSYDQSIIIWRRDREGIWKTAHILRQEEGAAAALRRTPSASTSMMPSIPSPLAPEARSNHNPPPPSASAPPALQHTPPTFTHVEHPIIATITPQTTASYTQMIDASVPQGPGALQQALTAYPTMLTYHSHIQTAIDRETNAVVRSQLRQVVSTALVRAQIAQNRIRESVQQALSTTSDSAEASSSQAYPATHATAARSSHRHTSPGQSNSAVAGTSNGPPLNHAANIGGGGGPPNTANSTSQQAQQQTSQPAPQAQIQTPATAAPQAQGQATQPHPHLAPADASPARIFKLQFDARQIICCSQVSTIVGWDFCNGDPELEEAARFFGTVE
ncbi:WD40 repeat-like protein [Xylariaceae sp. FL0662B]|nr:WD40 repeat-like protein [Xylariaceae sp. FL0662B]